MLIQWATTRQPSTEPSKKVVSNSTVDFISSIPELSPSESTRERRVRERHGWISKEEWDKQKFMAATFSFNRDNARVCAWLALQNANNSR